VKDAIGGIISSTKLGAVTDALFDAGLTSSTPSTRRRKCSPPPPSRAATTTPLSTASVALAAGAQMTHNSRPPEGAVPTDTLSTLNLVYELKNPKLAPE
jgi:hypothetical protein